LVLTTKTTSNKDRSTPVALIMTTTLLKIWSISSVNFKKIEVEVQYVKDISIKCQDFFNYLSYLTMATVLGRGKVLFLISDIGVFGVNLLMSPLKLHGEQKHDPSHHENSTHLSILS